MLHTHSRLLKLLLSAVFLAGTSPLYGAEPADPIPAVEEKKDPFTVAAEQLRNEDPLVRRQSITELRRMRDPRVIPLLLNALEDKAPEVRSAAANALGRQRTREAVARLRKMTEADKHPAVRQQAAGALGAIGDPAAVNTLITALKDDALSVRFAAISALGQLRVAAAAADLEALLRDPSAKMRRSAAAALGQISAARSLGPLHQALTDQDDYVRLEAIRALRRVSGPKRKDAFLPLLKDPDHRIRLEAAALLASLGGAQWLPPVIESLRHPERQFRRQAAQILGESGGMDQALDALRKAAKTEKDAATLKVIESSISFLERRHSREDSATKKPEKKQ
ncbi:MAG: HEAT repeat domain-containing protein [Elusimicrobiota bacterium]